MSAPRLRMTLGWRRRRRDDLVALHAEVARLTARAEALHAEVARLTARAEAAERELQVRRAAR